MLNILWIVLDDANAYAPGFALQHRHCYMPNLQRLQALGTTFTNAQANVSLCEPSRPGTFLGIHPVVSGQIHSYPASFRDRSYLSQAISIQQHLDANGYQVRLTGKCFHDSVDSWAGVGNETYAMARVGWNTNYGPYCCSETFSTFPDSMVEPNPGWPAPINADKSFGAGRLSERLEDNPWYYGTHGYYGYDGVKRGEFKYNSASDRSLMPDEHSTEWALEWLSGGTPTAYTPDATSSAKQPPVRDSRPWAMFVGFTGPHVPLWTPDEFYDAVLDHFGITAKDVELPPRHGGDESLLDSSSTTGDLADIPTRLQQAGGSGRTNFADLITASPQWAGGAPQIIRDQLLAYLARLYMVDVQIGRLLDYLESSGELDNTVIVVQSDNGFSFSEKRWDFKMDVWRTATNVPVVIVAPGFSGGQTCNFPISLHDLYPTVVDLLELAAPATPGVTPALTGDTLKPFLVDPSTSTWSGPPVALSAIKTGIQTAGELTADDVDPNEMTLSVRSRYWTYTASYWSGGTVQEELYCTARDRNEWENLASVARYSEVKQWFDYWLCTLSTTAGGLARTRAYVYTPSSFHPDDLVDLTARTVMAAA